MTHKEMTALIGKLWRANKALTAKVDHLTQTYNEFVEACESQPRSITEEIDSIPGRRIFYLLSDTQDFTIAQDGQRGAAMNFQISQDGPYVMTHFPVVMWLPNQPATATNFGRWRPVYTWPLPDQVLDTDVIDLSYEVQDGGAQRNFQNEPAAPVFSRPDVLHPLPVPTLWSPNSNIIFFPTYENIAFDTGAAVPTTGGSLRVTFPGYRIANL